MKLWFIASAILIGPTNGCEQAKSAPRCSSLVPSSHVPKENPHIDMYRKLIFGISLLALCLVGHSQVSYYGKAESGYSIYLTRLIQVDPNPNWQGYDLNDQQNGLELNLVNGVKIKDVFGVGGGLGYLNFQGIDGVSIFGVIDLLQKQNKLSAIVNARLGYNHIWNQYENGSGGAMLELGVGCGYPISDQIGIYLQTGISLRLQAVFFPLKIGIQF